MKPISNVRVCQRCGQEVNLGDLPAFESHLFGCGGDLKEPAAGEVEWGGWRCPWCGYYHEDADDLVYSTCTQCSANVQLGPTDEYGYRQAWVLSRAYGGS